MGDTSGMFPDSPITDIVRLAEIRNRIADLKAEEARVRDRLLTLRDGLHGGGNAPRLRIETRHQKHLERKALPPAVLADPGVWTTRRTRVLRLLD